LARHSSPGQRTTPLLNRFSFEIPVPTFGTPALAGAGLGGPAGGSARSWPPAPSAPPAAPAPRPGHGAQTSAFVPGGGGSTRLAAGGRGRARTGGPAPAPASRRGRTPATGGLLRGRLAVAAVAAGALATAGHSLAVGAIDEPSTGTVTGALALRAATGSTADADGSGSASTTSAASTPTSVPTSAPARGATPGAAATTDVLPVSPVRAASAEDGGGDELGSLSKSRRLADAAAARELAARAPAFVTPAEGRFTSGFGARWGTSHNGIDIANRIGTPIVSVGDGTVVEAGPASGFGQWVRVRLDDGTINVYGHVNRFFVEAGQKVTAGEEIAEIGNRGQSTGPHLHFEVWTPAGKKINPLPWLAERGIALGGGGSAASD